MNNYLLSDETSITEEDLRTIYKVNPFTSYEIETGTRLRLEQDSSFRIVTSPFIRQMERQCTRVMA
jgi:hypothetical protein